MQHIQLLDATQKATLCEENDAIGIPLLEMFGCWDLRIQIAELGIPLLYSTKVLDNVNQTKKRILPETSKYYSEIQEDLLTMLQEEKIEASVKPHPHSNLNIYRKMRSSPATLPDLLLQVRLDIVAKSPSECYQILGLIHRKWGQVQGHPLGGGYFRDLIGTPKFTGYSCNNAKQHTRAQNYRHVLLTFAS